MKATRHNGRSGKHGSYNPKHNDRNFDLAHSEHIDEIKALQNVYWDCYTGKRTATQTEEYECFDAIELRFYEENYGAFVENQNERNAINRHTERNRTIEDIYQNKKTCPEESIYQLGNIDGHVDSKVLMQVAEDFFDWFEDTCGHYVHRLDWALHVDEATPHIHERHVFDAPNKYGEIAPQQDRALELMGIELPYPDKPKSKSNNRKMVFDAICRDKFLEICGEYGLSVDKEAEYGGRTYLEKQDFIIQNQKNRLGIVNEELATQEGKLEKVQVEMAAIDTIVNSIAASAYDSTCNLISEDLTDKIMEHQVHEVEKAEESELFASGGYYGYQDKRILRGLVDRIKSKFQEAKSEFTSFLKYEFKDTHKRSAGIEAVTNTIWSNLERIARNGPNDYEIHFGEDLDYESMGEIGQQSQEVAQEIIRKGRGKHR